MISLLQSQSFMRDPAPQLSELRKQGPLVQMRLPILGKVWLTTTQAAAAHVMKDSDNFTVRKRNGKVVGLSWWMPRDIKLLARNMLASDDPDHKRLRSLVDQAFHRREVLTLDRNIEALSKTFSGNLFRQNQIADIIPEFARPFPLAVICELLGLPAEDRPKFVEWASRLTRVTGIMSFLLSIRSLRPLTRYIEDKIGEARQTSGSGLLHELVELQKQGGEISDDELIAMVFLLLLAGHETTTHLISGGLFMLLQYPDELEKLKEDFSRLDLAVEEILRFVSPVQTSKPRFVQQDCEVEGIRLSAGDLVMPFLVAANFDPAVFDKPEVFDISRKPNRHIEFGTGVHFCLGHQLARIEVKHALKTLLTDYPELKLAVPADEIRWNERLGLRSLKSLPVQAS